MLSHMKSRICSLAMLRADEVSSCFAIVEVVVFETRNKAVYVKSQPRIHS